MTEQTTPLDYNAYFSSFLVSPLVDSDDTKQVFVRYEQARALWSQQMDSGNTDVVLQGYRNGKWYKLDYAGMDDTDALIPLANDELDEQVDD